MARKTQPRSPKSPRFTLTPVAPLEVVQKGLEVAKADLVARLTRQSSENAKLAGVKQKLGRVQLEVMEKAGDDVKALVNEARELSQAVRGAPKERLPVTPGLQPQIPVDVAQVPGLSVARPPYSYDWTATGYIHYAPGPLSAYAYRQTGDLGFDDEPTRDQADASYAAAAVGIAFRPQSLGLLTVATDANIADAWSYYSSWAGSNTRGWAGFLVQAYDTNNLLVATPVYQQIILFDEGSTGGIFAEGNVGYDSFNRTFATPAFVVSSNLWYAIWFWCGGDIHGEGMNEFWGTGSFATAWVAASVPSITLYFY